MSSRPIVILCRVLLKKNGNKETMDHFKKTSLFFCAAAVLFFVGLAGFFSYVYAADGKITGWAWAGNDLVGGSSSGTASIGWISFSGSNCGGTSCNGTTCTGTGFPSGCPNGSYADYGVTITNQGDGTANLGGYAWSDNLGWITFNQSELSGCPSGTCAAKLDISSGKITGWARVCAVFQSGCSGTLKSNTELGGWDGWIKLSGTTSDGHNYGWTIDAATGDFHGNIFGSTNTGDPAGAGVIGWISANCQEGGASGGNICASSNYKLHTDFIQLTAKMACDASACQGSQVFCDCDAAGNCANPNSTWKMYQPIGGCDFILKNFSTPAGQIQQSQWTIGSFNQTISGKADLAVPSTILSSAIPYDVTLKVSNGLTDSTVTHKLLIMDEIRAGFMCSVDNTNWRPCSTMVNSIPSGATLYLKDDSTIPGVGLNYSLPSSGASLTSRNWTMTPVVGGVPGTPVSINPIIEVGTPPVQTQDTNSITASTPLNGVVIIKLTVYDSNGRIGSREYTFRANPMPKWKEISPLGIKWQDMLAGLYGILNGALF